MLLFNENKIHGIIFSVNNLSQTMLNIFLLSCENININMLSAFTLPEII